MIRNWVRFATLPPRPPAATATHVGWHGMWAHPRKQTAALPGAQWLQGQAECSHENPETKPSVKPDTAQGHRNSKSLSSPKALWWGIFLSTCVQRRNNSSLDAYLRWQEHISSHLLGKTIQGHGHLRREFFRAFLWTNSQAQTKQSVWKHSCDKTDPHPCSLTWPQVSREARADQHPD